MQQPKMIVLGLLAQGMKYGLEMEKFIDASKMRLWARIGNSTIYKALLDLQKDGAVTAKASQAERGPGKTVYQLTKKGRADFERHVDEALKSEESVYSDRIAGLVFALSLPPKEAHKKIEGSIKGLEFALANISGQKEIHGNHPIAMIVLEFYLDVFNAECRAMKAFQSKILKTR